MHASIASCFFVILISVCDIASTLRLNRIDVPAIVAKGSSIWLHCDYDLEADSLYSVKWYKNNLEFYRFMVLANDQKPEHKYFAQPGVDVEMKSSNITHVYLKHTDLNTEGLYACEVSTDAPSFQTIRADKHLKIYVLPEKGIRIKSKRSIYENGDRINVTCMSGPSKPPPLLFWRINGRRLTSREANVNLSAIATERNSDGLITSSLSLEFLLSSEKHFSNGEMTLSCTSLVSQTYCISFTELVIEERGRRSQMAKYDCDSQRPSPRINGYLSNYNVGQILNVNCSILSSNPIPYLQWFINERQATSNESIVYSHDEMYEEQFKSFASLYDSYATINEEKTLIVVLGLRLLLTKNHFQTSDGQLTLRCTSMYPKIIQSDRQELVLLRNGRQSSYLLASDAAILNTRYAPTLRAHLFTHFLLSFIIFNVNYFRCFH